MAEELIEQCYEVIDGKEIMMARPKPLHSKLMGRIYRRFEEFLENRRCEAFFEVDVFMDEQNLVPDISVLCDMSKLKGDGIHGAPDLVVEVLSPSTKKYDLGRKKEIYEENGVREYWIVSVEDRSVQCYILEDGRFVPREVGDEFSPYIFKDMKIKKADIFEKIDFLESFE